MTESRKELDSSLTVRLPLALLKQFQRLAIQQRRRVSDMMRVLIEDAIQREKDASR